MGAEKIVENKTCTFLQLVADLGKSEPVTLTGKKKPNMKRDITQVAIVGEQLVRTVAEAGRAARETLDWNGSSEGDVPLEYEVISYDGVDEFEVRPCWGRKSNRHDCDLPHLAKFAVCSDAQDFADLKNGHALAEAADVHWYKLPEPINYAWFFGCERGRYPQTRTATIEFSVDGAECVSVSGHGNAPFTADHHSNMALIQAVANLVTTLEQGVTIRKQAGAGVAGQILNK